MSEVQTRHRMTADDRRDQIVSAARQLFAANGYNATTTRELARAAEVSDALLYRHFANKRDVLDQVVDQAIATFSSLPELNRLQSLPTEALFHVIGTGFLQRVTANLDLITIMVGDHSSVTDSRFSTFIDTAARALGNDLARRNPSLSSDQGYLTARSFFGSLISFVLLQSVLGMDDVHPLVAAEYLDQVVRLHAG